MLRWRQSTAFICCHDRPVLSESSFEPTVSIRERLMEPLFSPPDAWRHQDLESIASDCRGLVWLAGVWVPTESSMDHLNTNMCRTDPGSITEQRFKFHWTRIRFHVCGFLVWCLWWTGVMKRRVLSSRQLIQMLAHSSWSTPLSPLVLMWSNVRDVVWSHVQRWASLVWIDVTLELRPL